MKVIDLLNKIANGEEVPKKISIRGNIFDIYSCSSIECYYRSFNGTDWLDDIDIKLDDEVEILDEEDEFIEIEELDIKQNGNLNYYIENEYGTHCGLTKHSKMIADKVNDLIKNQKKIINKLKEEGK